MLNGLIEVIVTVNMAGAHVGQHRWVDPENPHIAERLSLGYLIRVAPESEPETTPEQGVVEEP